MRIAALALCATTFLACDRSADSSVTIDGASLIAASQLAGLTLDRLVVRVSAADLAERAFELDVESDSTTFDVPAGVARRFVLEGTVTDGGFTFSAFSGETIADLEPGPNELVIAYSSFGALQLGATSAEGAAISSGTVTLTGAQGQPTVVQLGTPTVLPPGDYSITSPLIESTGTRLLLDETLTISAGRLTETELSAYTLATKCLPSAAEEVRAIAPSCQTVSFEVQNLQSSMTLSVDGVTGQVVTSSGPGTFEVGVPEGLEYAVTVLQQPTAPRQLCTVDLDTGFAISTASNPVALVSCGVPFYVPSVEVFGEPGSGFSLRIASNDSEITLGERVVSSTGVTVFEDIQLADSESFNVYVEIDPEPVDGVQIGCWPLEEPIRTVNGQDPTPIKISCMRPIAPIYPGGEIFGTWINNDGPDIYSASNTPCDPELDGYDACIHASMLHEFTVPGLTDCTGLQATLFGASLDWSCDASSGHAVFRSREGEFFQLRDAIDSTNETFYADNLEIRAEAADGFPIYSPSAVLWENPIVLDNDGGNFGVAHQIVLTSSPISGSVYSLQAPGVALLAFGSGLAGVPAGVAVQMQGAFGWLEHAVLDTMPDAMMLDPLVEITGAYPTIAFATLNSTRGGPTVRLSRGGHAMIRDSLFAGDFNTTIEVPRADAASFNTFDGTRFIGSGNVALHLEAPFQRVIETRVEGSGSIVPSVGLLVQADSVEVHGFRADQLDSIGAAFWGTTVARLRDLRVSDVSISNAGFSEGLEPCVSIVEVDASRFTNIRASSCDAHSVTVDEVSGTVFRNITAAYPVSGFSAFAVSNVATSYFESILAFGTTETALDIGVTAGTTFNGLVAADAFRAVELSSVDDGTFDGVLAIGNINATPPCGVLGGTNPGLDAGCLAAQSSSATLLTGAEVGLVVNPPTSDSTYSGALIDSAFSILNWSSFDDEDRAWATNALPPMGPCRGSAQCVLNSFRPESSSVRLGTAPTANALKVRTQRFVSASLQAECDALVPGSVFASGACEETFLSHAREFFGDGIGDDDDLCESGETCLYTPNIGNYQGHGSPVVTFSGDLDGLTDLVIYAYPLQGGL